MLRRTRLWLCRKLRMRLRWRCWCRPVAFCSSVAAVCLVMSIVCFTLAFRHRLSDTLSKCQDQESLDIIADYCQAYRDGHITGSLCHPLCQSRLVQFQECTSTFHAGKQVNIMTCSHFCQPGETIPAVLKYPYDNISSIVFKHPETFPYDDVEEVTVSDFYKHADEWIRKTFYQEFGFVPSRSGTNLTELIWERDAGRGDGGGEGGGRLVTESRSSQRVAFRSLMMALDQSEFRAVRLLESSGLVPGIYGTCGPMYLQQSCPPGVLDEIEASFEDKQHVLAPWWEKVLALIQLLQLIRRMELDLPEVLHLCDVKGTNFGVCRDGSVRLIDADTVFFHSRMLETFSKTRCKMHDDCHFFDCKGWCPDHNHSDNTSCLPVITNNNLETLCRDVLTSDIPSLFGVNTLFAGAPASVASKLKDAAHQCLSHRATESQGPVSFPVRKPPLSLVTTLTQLLEQSLAEEDSIGQQLY